ncbi:heavy metal translocating P-type ATPase (plasmid) [Acuticoccus sp. MNP-M23]|uniref:heavy metal translocating P-type ATPase n=1 Tax=Acuticoccus sp. MNP-M23 TaxID=3072793 RepID=UPI00281592A6|nr:heavy metal translocating P-type ATPase [Acuticoccus sp. MNP-M23]WMS45204.1 heavy metal translocating P-type ATPase [Acuticoccus sp. MNP-M23]
MTTTLEAREWTITGMDCAACAAKVKGAVERLPGVQDVNVTIMSERLRLTTNMDQTPPERVEAAVRAVGYGIHPRPAPAATLANTPSSGHVHADEPETGRSWWQTDKGHLVLMTGALLAAAWVIDLVAPPDVARFAFIAATLRGVLPVGGRALASLRAGMPFTIEMLMTIAAIGALAIDAAQEAALVLFLFAVGEVLEGVAANKARDGIRSLARLVPKTALIEEDGETREVAAASLAIGQIVLVRPGDRIPADGDVVEGASGVDESPVTGESVPRLKEPGDPVFAGSINAEAALRVRVTRAAEDNTISRVIKLVEEAETARAPTERFIDRFSRIYMPAVVGVAIFVAVVPPLLAGAPWETWIYRGLALLLIGCPCALVISVPASIASALSSGARRGLLMKGGAVIELAARTTAVVFDKTGTLTAGRPRVTEIVPFGGTEKVVLSLAAAIETGSSHPLALAILERAKADGVTALPATGAKALAGRGAEASVGGETVAVGSPRYADERGVLDAAARETIGRLEAEGKTVVAVFRPEKLVGVIALRDEPREDAADAVRQLNALGISSTMLTGDNARTAAAISGGLGMNYRAELMPEDKVAAIREMIATGRVMMVGDGINDAPALATASVGVAMGSGTDVALETAQAAILRNRVTDVAALIRLARAAMGNIRQNIAIALGLKTVFLVTTVLGITGLWIAILADTGATVLVTLNALRLLVFDPKKRA